MINNYDEMYNISEEGVLLGINKTLNITEDCDGLVQNWLKTIGEMEIVNIPATCRIIQTPIDEPYDCNLKTKQFNINAKNEIYTSIDGSIYTFDKKTFLLYPTGKEEITFCFDDSVETIEKYSMMNVSLENIYMGPNLKKIRESAFFECTKLRRIYISSTDLEFDERVFEYLDDDRCNAYIGGIKGSAAEKYCNTNGIKFVAIDEIDMNEFFDATDEDLDKIIEEQIDLEGDITIEVQENGIRLTIEGSCLKISAIDKNEVIPTHLGKIISSARRRRIKKIIFGSGVKSIKEWCIDAFENLEELYIGADVEQIYPFYTCLLNDSWVWTYKIISNQLLSDIEVSHENKNYRSINSVIYSHDLRDLVLYPPGKKELLFEVPPFVERIKNTAFRYANKLRSVKIGETVETIENRAFQNNSIERIYLDEKVKDLGETLFFDERLSNEDRAISKFKCGGKSGSSIEKYCKENNLNFEAVDDAYQFLISLPEKN
jgi:hypothetical protein